MVGHRGLRLLSAAGAAPGASGPVALRLHLQQVLRGWGGKAAQLEGVSCTDTTLTSGR